MISKLCWVKYGQLDPKSGEYRDRAQATKNCILCLLSRIYFYTFKNKLCIYFWSITIYYYVYLGHYLIVFPKDRKCQSYFMKMPLFSSENLSQKLLSPLGPVLGAVGDPKMTPLNQCFRTLGGYFRALSPLETQLWMVSHEGLRSKIPIS